MIPIKESSLYRSLESEGTIFGPQAEKKLSEKGTMSTDVTPLQKGDIIVFPYGLITGYSRRFGGFVLVHILKGGDPNEAQAFRLFPGSVKKTLFPVEADFDGNYVSTGIRPKNNGTLVDHVNSYGNFADAFKAMQGKAAKVTGEIPHTVLRFGTKDETREAYQHTIDIIEVTDELKPFTEMKVDAPASTDDAAPAAPTTPASGRGRRSSQA